MNTILIGASVLAESLISTFIRIFGPERVLMVITEKYVFRSGERPDLLISVVRGGTRIDDDCALLLLPRDSDWPVLERPLTVIADSARETWPENFAGELISCGRSAKDTFTLSSQTEDSAVVALVRRLSDFAGEVIEPCEVPVSFTGKDPFLAFATVAVLMLAGSPAASDIFRDSSNNLQL